MNTKSAANDRRDELLAQAQERLTAAVETLREGTGWKAWLDMASHLPSYSVNNQLLILMQNPDATMTAGFRKWESLGRTVLKGEKALRIFAPIIYNRKEPATPTAGATAPPPKEARVVDGVERAGTRVLGFKAVPVFDISQTEGDPIPEPPNAVLLDGEAPQGLWVALTDQITTAGFTVERVASAATIGGANGRTTWRARTVEVRADVSEAQAVKTLAHELAHVLRHNPADGGDALFQCAGQKEVVAESVAYLVAAHSGLNTSEYTFPYVAGWSASAKSDVMTATAEEIRLTARSIIDQFDPAPAPALPAHTDIDPPTVAVMPPLPWRSADPAAQLQPAHPTAPAPVLTL